MENKLSWFDRIITPKKQVYKNFIQRLETTSPEIWFQDGERKFTDLERKFLQIYKYKTGIEEVTASEILLNETKNQGFENKDNEIVGKITFLDSGEVMEYNSDESYLSALEKELDSNIGGFRYETLIKSSELIKAVDDLVYGAYGEENPNTLESSVEKVNTSETNIIISNEGYDNPNNDLLLASEKITTLHRQRNYELLADNFSAAKEIEYQIIDLEKQIENINNQNPNIMETQNDFDQVQYLKDQMKYLGFGEGEQLHKDLEKGIKAKEQQFEIKTGSDKALPGNLVDFTLKFNKTERGGIFLNSYQAKLTTENNEEHSHNFPVSKENSFTAKEAINLLEGRSVKIEFLNPKTEQVEPAFVQFDFNQSKTDKGNYFFQNFYKKYGVDTDKIVDKANLIFDKPEWKDNAIKSLEKGNIVKVKFKQEDSVIEGKAILDPQNRNLKLYDNDMNRLNSNKPLEGLEQENKHEKNNVKEQNIKR